MGTLSTLLLLGVDAPKTASMGDSMTSLLDNELVKRYFGCESNGGPEICTKRGICDECMAFRVLSAMQEPIRKGERCLELGSDGCVEELQAINDNCKEDVFHAYQLRLPDKFQKRECEHDWKCKCGAGFIVSNRDKLIEEEQSRASQWRNRAALAENFLLKIEKEVAERDYGEWGKNLRNILAERRQMLEGKPSYGTSESQPQRTCVCLCHLQGYASSCPNCREKHQPQRDEVKCDCGGWMTFHKLECSLLRLARGGK